MSDLGAELSPVQAAAAPGVAVPHEPARRSLVARAADHLNPFQLLFGPIFQKEVRSAGRKRFGYIGRALYSLTLLVVVGLVFWGLWRDLARTQSSVMRLQQMQQMAPVLAVTMLWFQFVMLALTAPNLTAPAIADEKRTGALAALLTTPMTAGQIIGGKLSGRTVHIVILTLLGMPVLLAVRIFGGVEASFIVQATAVTLANALLGASLGLIFSIWNRRATGAGVFGLLTLALLQAFVPAIDGMLYYWYSETGYSFHMQNLAFCSPATLFLLTESSLRGGPPPDVSYTFFSHGTAPGWTLHLGPMWLVSVVYSLSLSLLLAFVASVVLRRAMLNEAGRDAGSTTERPRARGKKRRAPAVVAVAPVGAPAATLSEPAEKPAGERISGRQRIVGDNPVLWREVRQPTLGSRRRFLIAAGVTVAGMLFLYINFGVKDNEGLHGTMAVIGALAVMLQSVFMTTGGFVGEREGRTWDVLLTTPLSGGDIAFGKLAGSLRSQWFLPAVVLLHFLFASVMGYIHPIILAHLVLTFAGPVLLFSCTGLFLSLCLRKSTPASVCNLLVALLFWLVPWLLLGLIAFMTQSTRTYQPRDFFEVTTNVLCAFNPVVMAVSAFEPALRGAMYHRVSSLTYEFGSGAGVSTGTFTLILAGVFVTYATLAAGVFWATVALFRRISGRSS